MSTRSTTHFVDGDEVKAIVYRHSDGYPDGHGADLLQFFADVRSQTSDTRFDDPTYLAAKLVVWLARRFAITYDWRANPSTQVSHADTRPLDFLSVGVCLEDPGDIEYRYVVHCDDFFDGRPRVEVQTPDGTMRADDVTALLTKVAS